MLTARSPGDADPSPCTMHELWYSPPSSTKNRTEKREKEREIAEQAASCALLSSFKSDCTRLLQVARGGRRHVSSKFTSVGLLSWQDFLSLGNKLVKQEMMYLDRSSPELHWLPSVFLAWCLSVVLFYPNSLEDCVA